MVHPLLALALVTSGIIVVWGGYEAYQTMREWHHDRQERREYEEYIRTHAEKSRNGAANTLFENSDDEEGDDNQPLSSWNSNLRDHELRQRKRTQAMEDEKESDSFHSLRNNFDDISEMERSISLRKSRLERENELLLKEEKELEERKQSLNSRGNSIIGVAMDEEIITNPFADALFHEQESASASPVIVHQLSDEDDWSEISGTRRSSTDSFK